MIRKIFQMAVHPEKHQEYIRRHNPIWPELEAVLKAHGVHNYTIALYPATSQLFGCVEVEDEARWRQIAETEICKKWWAYMQDLMPTNADNSPVVTELVEVFHLP